MSNTAELTVPQQATRTFSDPASSHTIADRKNLTEDALKLSEHELKKELTRRIEEAGKLAGERWEEMDPHFVAYNKAVKGIADSLIGAMVSDIQFSFGCINRLGSTDHYGSRGDPTKLDVSVQMNDGLTLFWCSEAAKSFRDDYHAHLNKTRYRGVEWAKEVVCLVEADEAGSDLDIFIDITVESILVDDDDERGESETLFEMTKILEATGSTELMEARIAIAAAYAPYAEAVEKLHLAKKDLENLPKMMKELEMQATAQRLQDAGGQSLLMGVLHGVSRLLQGEQISGLHLAVPEAKHTIMGAPDEHGPESTAPETPVVETPAADAAPSEETAAPAEEAAAPETSAEGPSDDKSE